MRRREDLKAILQRGSKVTLLSPRTIGRVPVAQVLEVHFERYFLRPSKILSGFFAKPIGSKFSPLDFPHNGKVYHGIEASDLLHARRNIRMFEISDFSKISGVSVKTLRFYDQLGLLKPARTDETTGYRYYTAEPLLRLHRILAYKDLGFALDQIRIMPDEGVPTVQR